LAAGLISIVPSPLRLSAGAMISQVPFTPFNLGCTKVPGPQFPLYVLGHKRLRWYPCVPIGGELAVNCAILSYDGMVYFGFSGDAHAAPDLTRFEKLLKTSFEELKVAARIVSNPGKTRGSARGKKLSAQTQTSKSNQTQLSKAKKSDTSHAAAPGSVISAHSSPVPISFLPVQPAVQTALKPQSIVEDKNVLTQLMA
jgi:WS/DGAT C-terminal domain